MNLHRVLPGKYLHYPSGTPSTQSIGGRDRIWLKPDGIVDLEDPFIAECVKGQEYKLEPDPKAKAADPLPHPGLIRARETFMAAMRGDPPAATKAEKLELVGAGAIGSVPAPDARPQRSKV